MSKNKICVACGFEDFEDNINNFCCNCGKDIDTGLTLEEMDKQSINYIIDRRTNEYKNDITKNNDINYMHIIDFEDYLNAETQAEKDKIAKGFYDCLTKTTQINGEFLKENLKLKAELAEKDKLLENAIVPKFKYLQKVWYINSNKQVTSGVIYNIQYDSDYGISYYIPNLQLENFRIKEINLFATSKQAEEALKKLEEK